MFRAIAVALVPVSLFAGYQIEREAEMSRQRLERLALGIAQGNAARIGDSLHTIEILLRELATRPGVRKLDPERCDAAFAAGFHQLYPQHANLLTKDVTGRPVCSSRPIAPGTRLDPTNYLDAVQRSGGFAIGKANFGAISKRWVVPLDYPLHDDSGALVGTVSAPLDLLKFNSILGQEGLNALPPGTRATLFASDMTMLARSFEPEKWIGSKRVFVPQLTELIGKRSGTTRFVSSLDGVDRIHGAAAVPGTDWTALVSIPVASFEAEMRRSTLLWIGAGALSLGFSMLLAYWLGGWISRPIQRVAAAADEVADGNQLARAPVAGATEIVHFANSFNTMLDRLEQQRIRLEQSEMELARESFRNQLFLHRASDGIHVLDEHGYVVEASDRFCAMLGYSRAEVIGMNVTQWDASHPAETLLSEIIPGMLRQDEVATFETMHRCKSGATIEVEVNIVGFDLDGRRFLYASSRDIGERKRAERMLREGETRFHQIFETNSAVKLIIEPNSGRIVEANAAACRFYGYPRDTLLALRIQDLNCLSPDEVAAEMELARQGNRLYFNFKHRLASGEVRDVEVYSGPVTTPQGVLLHSIVHDVSERVRAEALLRHERDFIDAVLDTAGSLIAVIDREGAVVRFNRAAEDFTGYTFAEVQGQPFFWEKFLLPEQVPGVNAVFEHIRAGNIVNRYENYWCRRDGGKGLFEWSNTLLFDGEGKMEYLITIGTDITKRKEAEDALRQINETLEQRIAAEVAKNMEHERMLIQQSRLAAMGEMIGNIAHQWRQPLNTLALLLANIKDAYEFGELDDAILERSMGDGNRLIQKMSSTIDDFRDFFKPNREKQAFRIRTSVGDTLNLVSASFRSNNIEVQVDGGDDMQVYGFPNEFSQVLLNVLNNAKDAYQERKRDGGIIRISLAREGDLARLALRDDAGGIPEAILGKVFDPYFTTKQKGTGIGLYMSKMIMDHMGGGIEVRNVEGGAEFVVTVPVFDVIPPVTHA